VLEAAGVVGSAPGGRARAQRRPLLVVSAFAPELAPLRAAAGAGVRLRPVGIGAVDAAAGAARALCELRPRAILFVGTAGAYAAGAPGDVVIVRRAALASTAAVRGDGYLPAPMVTEARADVRLTRALARAAAAAGATATSGDAATTLAITRTRALGARLGRAAGAAVENLEVFAVARAAAAARVPFAAVLGVANRVGPTAHAEWRAHGGAAAAAACAVIARYLEQAG